MRLTRWPNKGNDLVLHFWKIAEGANLKPAVLIIAFAVLAFSTARAAFAFCGGLLRGEARGFQFVEENQRAADASADEFRSLMPRSAAWAPGCPGEGLFLNCFHAFLASLVGT